MESEKKCQQEELALKKFEVLFTLFRYKKHQWGLSLALLLGSKMI
jgi:hypothetical protein